MEYDNTININEEDLLMEFVGLLIINGFAVDYLGDWKFKIWLRGVEEEFAYIIFKLDPEKIDVDILEAGGEYYRFKYSKKHREFFVKTIQELYYKAESKLLG